MLNRKANEQLWLKVSHIHKVASHAARSKILPAFQEAGTRE
jgi:hypothetical protein